jgi:hypothetical protein
MKPKTPESEPSKGPTGDKAYVKPELKEFGDVAELTRALTVTGANDGGKSTMTKT